MSIKLKQIIDRANSSTYTDIKNKAIHDYENNINTNIYKYFCDENVCINDASFVLQFLTDELRNKVGINYEKILMKCVGSILKKEYDMPDILYRSNCTDNHKDMRITYRSDCPALFKEIKSYVDCIYMVISSSQSSKNVYDVRIVYPVMDPPIYNRYYNQWIGTYRGECDNLRTIYDDLHTIEFENVAKILISKSIIDYVTAPSTEATSTEVTNSREPRVDDALLFHYITHTSVYFTTIGSTDKLKIRRPTSCLVIDNSYGFVSKCINHHYNSGVETSIAPVDATQHLTALKHVHITCLVDTSKVVQYINSVYYGDYDHMDVVCKPVQEYMDTDLNKNSEELIIYNTTYRFPDPDEIKDKPILNDYSKNILDVLNAISSSQRAITLIILISSITFKVKQIYKKFTEMQVANDITITMIGNCEYLIKNSQIAAGATGTTDCYYGIPAEGTYYYIPSVKGCDAIDESFTKGMSKLLTESYNCKNRDLTEFLADKQADYSFHYQYCFEITKNILQVKK